MSLLEQAMEPCVIIDKSRTNDTIGGFEIRWTEGAQFDAALVLDSSIEAMTAQAQGVTALYIVTTHKIVNLQYHDVFKRLSDGKIFRVKSDGDDDKTPQSAGLDMRQVRAEEYILPTNQ